MTELRAKHAVGGGETWGIDGTTGKVVDMKDYGIWEPFMVKSQTLKTAIESACLLLRVDDIVSGVSRGGGGGGPSAQQQIEANEQMQDMSG